MVCSKDIHYSLTGSAAGYLRVVVTTLFCYSSVLAFGDEVTWIWLKPFTFGTIFYLIGRYVALASVIFASYNFRYAFDSTIFTACHTEYLNGGEESTPFNVLHYTGAIVATSAMILLQLRTSALYNKRKFVAGLFCVLDILAIVGFVLQLTLFQSSRFGSLGTLELVFKGNFINYYYSPIFWAPFLLNEMVTFLMVFFKYLRCKIKSRNVIMEARTTSLRSSLMKDNMSYFSLIFVVYASGLFTFLNDMFIEMFAAVHMIASIAISGILAPHLFIKLRKAYYNQGQDVKLATDISTFHATIPEGTDTQIE